MYTLNMLLAQVGDANEALKKTTDQFKESAEQSGIFSVEGVRNFLETSGKDFAINLVAAIAIFIIGEWVAKFVTGIIGRITERAGVDVTLRKFLGNLVYGIFMAFVVIASLDRLGVNTTSVAAIIAAAGLAIGMALQGTLSNFASGVMLILFKPVQVGDFVEVAGTEGIIDEIQIFNTILHSLDNVRIIIPNGSITSGTIQNFSAEGTRRIDMVIGCGYDDDVRAVKEFLQQLIVSDSRVLAEPAPTVAVSELADHSVNFVFRPWVRTEDYWGTQWDFLEAVKTGFAERGFTIPYPTRDLIVHQPPGIEQRAAA